MNPVIVYILVKSVLRLRKSNRVQTLFSIFLAMTFTFTLKSRVIHHSPHFVAHF